jgi:DNA-binding MarR family transcriptional regulator
LNPAGLTVTQYALLANISRAGKLSVTALAERLGMDRTTLTRNLRPLMTKKLIATSAGEDRRERVLSLAAAGKRKLHQSRPLWEEAQRRFASQLGAQILGDLRKLLTAAEIAAAN